MSVCVHACVPFMSVLLKGEHPAIYDGGPMDVDIGGRSKSLLLTLEDLETLGTESKNVYILGAVDLKEQLAAFLAHDFLRRS